MKHGEGSVRARLKAAFPWFDEGNWRWHYEPKDVDAATCRIPGVPTNATGTLSIAMPGASYDQSTAVAIWLIRELKPAYFCFADPALTRSDLGRTSRSFVPTNAATGA